MSLKSFVWLFVCFESTLRFSLAPQCRQLLVVPTIISFLESKAMLKECNFWNYLLGRKLKKFQSFVLYGKIIQTSFLWYLNPCNYFFSVITIIILNEYLHNMNCFCQLVIWVIRFDNVRQMLFMLINQIWVIVEICWKMCRKIRKTIIL